jgi:hypothetical protein
MQFRVVKIAFTKFIVKGNVLAEHSLNMTVIALGVHRLQLK